MRWFFRQIEIRHLLRLLLVHKAYSLYAVQWRHMQIATLLFIRRRYFRNIALTSLKTALDLRLLRYTSLILWTFLLSYLVHKPKW